MNKKAQERLTPEQQKALSLGIAILGLILFIVVLIIMIARVVFWISVILFFSSIVYFIIGIFLDISRTKYEDYFDGVPHILLAIALIFVFWLLAHLFFPIGYSEISYQMIDLNNQYQETMNLPFQITIQALNKTCETTPSFHGCDTLLKSYEMSGKISDLSDTAEALEWIFHIRYA